MRRVTIAFLSLFAASLSAQAAPTTAPLPPATTRDLDARIALVSPRVVAWRLYLYEHPELSFAEQRTAGVVAAHRTALELEVRANVDGTFGVVGILRGGPPGPAVTLRADSNALPVAEQTGLLFASKVTTRYNGQTVGVMYACGHDAHTAILMGVAEVLASMKATLPGTVTFLFQAAEEGAPNGGAKGLIDAGALDLPKVEAVDGLHTWPGLTGTVSTRSGGMMASGVNWRVVIHGKQAHGAQPWRSVDPIVYGAQIVTGLQTIVSRDIDLTAGGATATVTISMGYPTTTNDPRWFPRATTVLRNALGDARVLESAPSMPAEDFSRYLERAPGLFFFLGITPKGKDPRTMPANHSPLNDIDEAAMPTGVKALSALAIDALTRGVSPLAPTK